MKPGTNPDDADLLEAVLDKDDLADGPREAFLSMQVNLEKYGKLTPKQRAWAKATLDGVKYDPDPEYENLVSSGKVPRGREVMLLVRDKPLKPPGRR